MPILRKLVLGKDAFVHFHLKIFVAGGEVCEMLGANADITDDLKVDDLGEHLHRLIEYRIWSVFFLLGAACDENVILCHTP